METIKISVRQFTILIILFLTGSSILLIPGILAQVTKQDAWITAILGVGISLLLVLLYNAVGSIEPSMTLVGMNEKVFGKWVGKIVTTVFLFFTLVVSSELLYFMGSFMKIQIMPETPLIAFHLLFFSVVIIGVRYGLETIARFAEIIFPFFILLFILTVLLLSPNIEIQNVQPILETKPKPMIYSILLFVSFFSFSPIVLLMIFPNTVNNLLLAKKAFFKGTLIAGIIIIIFTLLTILVLGEKDTSQLMHPTFTLAKRIEIGNFIQRLEMIVAFIWIVTLFFKLILYFYATVVGFAQLVSIKDYRPLTLPLGLIVVALSVIVHPNIVHSMEYNKGAWLPFGATFGVLLPLLLLVVAKFKKN
ncbi:endospore germination permease [Sporosarcina sp. resist]|uniref:GerAB/ArcD/ProY family transporter n=1 Tax=Sporosarcina sp. resist TaxID=2762563 RepID=UPI00164DD808|nr:endospore germination permease [Sporosarcina sp. resist]QNK89129.1 endospore germination permease [Sporosarcina sp. resist]